jgi:hypothetical protein
MSVLEFIASLVGSLAWPVALLVVLLSLRKHLPALLSSLKRVKVSGFELELERARVEVAEMLSAHPAAPVDVAPREYQHTRSDQHPSVGILRSYLNLEAELRRRLALAGVGDLDGKSAPQLAAIGAREGVFTAATVEAVKGVTVMRNLVANGRTENLSPKDADEYAALVDATVFALGQRPEGTQSR